MTWGTPRPMHAEQRLSSYISGAGLEVYESEQYDAFSDDWYIVGDSSDNRNLIMTRIQLHNTQVEEGHHASK